MRQDQRQVFSLSLEIGVAIQRLIEIIPSALTEIIHKSEFYEYTTFSSLRNRKEISLLRFTLPIRSMYKPKG